MEATLRSPSHSTTPLNIWMLEDSKSDEMLTRYAIDNTHIPHVLNVSKSGRELMQQLEDPSAHMPDMLMLDLGVPDIDGFTFLELLAKKDARLRSIPIVILTGYKDFEYIAELHSLCIRAYINKPLQQQQAEKLLSN